jgi:hypothetical protein
LGLPFDFATTCSRRCRAASVKFHLAHAGDSEEWDHAESFLQKAEEEEYRETAWDEREGHSLLETN